MISPRGWQEPGQTPEFDEYTVVLRGVLLVETRTLGMEVRAGQAILTLKGEWVRYSTPAEDGAEYVAVCLPAFSLQTVHRDEYGTPYGAAVRVLPPNKLAIPVAGTRGVQ